MKALNYFVVVFVLASNTSLAQELIQDPTFQNGFFVRNTSTYAYEGPITCGTGLPNPVWSLVEWNSGSSALNLTPTTLGSGFCKWADPYKDFRFGPLGAEDYQLYFAANSDNEYNGVYRQNGEPWPHLLVEHRLSPPFTFSGQGPGCPPLSQLSALNFQIDGKLIYNQTIMEQGYSANLHAAQFQIFFTVQNLNNASAGFGKYVWLGMSLFDDRTPMTPGAVSYDIGTATLINKIPYVDHASETTHNNNNWVHNEIDLLPYALQALDTAWANGFLNESTNLADYKLGGMNMGWELPGRNVCTFVVKDLSLEAVSTVTSMEEHKDSDVQIYPNPATDFITVTWKTNQALSKVELFDLSGRMVLQQSVSANGNEWRLSLTELPSGTYVCKLRQAQNITFRKIVVE